MEGTKGTSRFEEQQIRAVCIAAKTPTSRVSIGVARKCIGNRLHTNNTRFSFFSYLIIGATISNNDGGYEYEYELVLSNDKYQLLLLLNATLNKLHIQEDYCHYMRPVNLVAAFPLDQYSSTKSTSITEILYGSC